MNWGTERESRPGPGSLSTLPPGRVIFGLVIVGGLGGGGGPAPEERKGHGALPLGSPVCQQQCLEASCMALFVRRLGEQVVQDFG